MHAPHHAFRTSGWAQRLPHERAAVLHRVAQLIREQSEALAQKQRLDNGKPISETRNLVASAAGTFQFFAAALETLEETITPSRGAFVTMSVHEPMGVVAAITPWNSPIASEAQKLAPALAAGNAVVVKPAEVTPLMALELARICEEAGVPKGIVSVLPGKGSVIGDAITKHPLVKRVSFTGGTTTGKHIAHIAADKMMPVSLELGGKSPTMVLDDADLDHAVERRAVRHLQFVGRVVHRGLAPVRGARAIYDEFLTRLAEGANALRVGDPAAERTQMGPLITAKHREGIERYVELGVSEGGRIRTGGVRPHGDGLDRGYFYTPTIIEGLSNNARISQEEIFGPVLVAMPFDNEEELIAQANDSVYALAAGVWSRDFKRAWQLGRAVQAGTVWVNTYKQFSCLDAVRRLARQRPGPREGPRGHLPVHGAEEHVLGHQRATAAVGELKRTTHHERTGHRPDHLRRGRPRGMPPASSRTGASR